MVAYHPGEILKDELQARWWTQKWFAELLCITTAEINDLIKGRRNITTRLALRIWEALGTSAEMRIRLQNHYDLYIEYKKKEEFNILKRISNNKEVIKFKKEAEIKYKEHFKE